MNKQRTGITAMVIALVMLSLAGTVSANTSIAGSSLTPFAISNVNALNITNTSATIHWETNRLSDSLVKYGVNDLGSTQSSAEKVTSHNIPLTSLIPNTTYNYSVKSVFSGEDSSSEIESGNHNFTTLNGSTNIVSTSVIAAGITELLATERNTTDTETSITNNTTSQQNNTITSPPNNTIISNRTGLVNATNITINETNGTPPTNNESSVFRAMSTAINNNINNTGNVTNNTNNIEETGAEINESNNVTGNNTNVTNNNINNNTNNNTHNVTSNNTNNNVTNVTNNNTNNVTNNNTNNNTNNISNEEETGAEINENNEFISTTSTQGTQEISGTIKNDVNENGQVDQGEPSLLGEWTVKLIGITGEGVNTSLITKEVKTTPVGRYSFGNLPNGRYIVILQNRIGFIVIRPVMHITLTNGSSAIFSDIAASSISDFANAKINQSIQGSQNHNSNHGPQGSLPSHLEPLPVPTVEPEP